MADLTTRIAEALVSYTTAGLCSLNGPCTGCDCFWPMHPRERDMAGLAVKEVAKYPREIVPATPDDVARLREFMDEHGPRSVVDVLLAVADEIEGDDGG